jgi:hypothetical protein
MTYRAMESVKIRLKMEAKIRLGNFIVFHKSEISELREQMNTQGSGK